MAVREDKIKQEVMDAGYLDTDPNLWTVTQEQNESLDGNKGHEEQLSAEDEYKIYYVKEEDCIEKHLQDEEQTSSVTREKREHLQTNIKQEPDKKVCRKKRSCHLIKKEGFQEQQSAENDESEIYCMKEGDLSRACLQEEHHESLGENHDIQEQQAANNSGYEIYYIKEEELLEPCLQEDTSGMNATTQSSIDLDEVLCLDNPLRQLRCQTETSDRVSAEREQTNFKQEPDRKNCGKESTSHLRVDAQSKSCTPSEDEVLHLDNPLQQLRCQIDISSDRVSAERKQTNFKQEPDRKNCGKESTSHLRVETQSKSSTPSEGRCDIQINSSSRNCYDDESNVYDTQSDGYSEHDRTCSIGKAHHCSECNRNYFPPRGLTRDISIQTGEKPFQCSVCKKSFSRKSVLTRHIRIHTGEKPYQCSVCNQSFSRKSVLTSHMTIHTGEKAYQCSVCNEIFSSKSYLTLHMTIHTGEKHQCSVCKKCFSRKSVLTRHIRIHNDGKPSQCSVCKQSFLRKTDLRAHMKIHTGEKPFQCSVCNQNFSRKSDLTPHMTIHTSEKHLCSVCKKSFSRKSDLTAHMKIHTSEKHQCSVCKQIFPRKIVLTAHMKTHSVEKPFQCSVCNQSFSRNFFLTRHIRIHTGEKPYQCSVCNQSFSRKYNLTAHMKIHTGAKPDECCDGYKMFYSKHNHAQHTRTHTKEKCNKSYDCISNIPEEILVLHTYRCLICNERFSSKYELSKHNYSCL